MRRNLILLRRAAMAAHRIYPLLVVAPPRNQRRGADYAASLSGLSFAQRDHATPAATARPVLPSTLSGCSAIERSKPPTSTLAPRPTPTVACADAPP